MKATKTVTGACEHCGGPIEFDANSIGSSVPCPYCRRPTEFHLPKSPEEPGIPRTLVTWTIIGILILVFGLVASMFALKLMEKKLDEHQHQREGVTTPRTP